MKRAKQILKVIGTLFIMVFLFTAYSIDDYSSNYFERASDVAIVLGARIEQEKPTPVFKERLNHAMYLYQNGIVEKILLTGGARPNSSEAESRYAKLYLRSLGVPDSIILTEEVSQNTRANLANAKEVMRKNRLYSALIVSDPLHMKRAMMFAQAEELNAEPSPTRTSLYKTYKSKVPFLFTETLFYLKSWMFGEFLPASF